VGGHVRGVTDAAEAVRGGGGGDAERLSTGEGADAGLVSEWDMKA